MTWSRSSSFHLRGHKKKAPTSWYFQQILDTELFRVLSYLIGYESYAKPASNLGKWIKNHALNGANYTDRPLTWVLLAAIQCTTGLPST